MDGNTGAVQTGGLGGRGNNQNPDGNTGGNHDGNTGGQHDAATAATCTTTPTDVGAPGSYTVNSPKAFSGFFVVKDSGGFYALSDACTHEGATLQAQSSQFYCPRHGATFDFDGNATGGPVFSGLVHYAMCVQSNGNLGVIKSQQVSQSTRIAG